MGVNNGTLLGGVTFALGKVDRAGLLILREKVLKPVLAGVQHPKRGRPPKAVAPLDLHYQSLQKEMLATLRFLKLAA
jgi:hypothetical protein